MAFTASGQEPPRAAEFRVAVSEKGTIQYCFLETSSGDAALDEQARKYLMLFRLAREAGPQTSAESELTWGTAIFEWGNDIKTPLVQTTGNTAP